MTSLASHRFQVIEPILNNFVLVLNVDITRMEQHISDLAKIGSKVCENPKENKELEKELIKARRSAEQLRRNLRELERARSQINQSDLVEFDSKFMKIHHRAEAILHDFEDKNAGDLVPGVIKETNETLDKELPLNNYEGISKNIHIINQEKYITSSSSCIDQEDNSLVNVPQSLVEKSILKTEDSSDWTDVKRDITELSSLIHSYSDQVECQQEKIDSIESNINSADHNVKIGTQKLGAAAKLKATLLPAVAGAVLGGALGGPVGLVAGAKIGAAAALGGSIVGFTGGRIIGKRQRKNIEIELSNMSDSSSDKQRSISQ